MATDEAARRSRAILADLSASLIRFERELIGAIQHTPIPEQGAFDGYQLVAALNTEHWQDRAYDDGLRLRAIESSGIAEVVERWLQELHEHVWKLEGLSIAKPNDASAIRTSLADVQYLLNTIRSDADRVAKMLPEPAPSVESSGAVRGSGNTFTPTDDDLKILGALASRKSRTFADMLRVVGMGSRKIKTRLPKLEAAGLVDRESPKSGWAITESGRARIASNAHA